MARPNVLPVQPRGIPQQLRAIPRWVLWRYSQRTKPDGSHVWAKLPLTVQGRAASSTDPSTWSTYDDACDALIVGDYDGLGLVLGDDLHGIDLDDCRVPSTGELSKLAQEVLERVQGYAEVSPSGTGIKLFSLTNLDGSRTNHELGVELYSRGRYFTVTGHALNGHDALPAAVQDLGWLVQRVWGEDLGRPAEEVEGDAAERALALYRPPLEDWTAERVADEVLTHLDPDAGYDEWLQVGQALHHQGQGDEAWLQLWDEWSALSSKWAEGVCEAKWRSFSEQRTQGRGALTLASLLKKTKDQRQVAARNERDATLQQLLQAIEDTADARDLQEQVGARIAHNPDLTDVDREQLAVAIQARGKDLGTRLPLGTVRGWLRARVRTSGGFVHFNDEGHPLCTMENTRALLEKLGFVVRYNVIKKIIEILIPNAGFSRDNRDNAAIACVMSECEKVRMPTKHVQQFLVALADENSYNPVATWIESRPWDGVSRLEAFYATVRCAPEHEPLKQKLLRKWLVQAVAAAFSPDGIAGQGILTFVGPQNIGKTSWFKRLAPVDLDAVLTGHTLDLRSKDSIFIALSFWLVELGEVDATMRKSDISALKSFVTQLLDKIRRPYAATESAFGRRTVFGATVNDQLYLHDPTGNRRFWTIEVEGFDLNHQVDMQQLWAEVLGLWQDGEQYYLDQGEVAELNRHNEAFTAVDPVEERLLSAYAWAAPELIRTWEWVTATEALVRAGVREPTKLQTITAARVLRTANGGQRKKSGGRVLFAVPGAGEDFLG